jgi:hypothetical protein
MIGWTSSKNDSFTFAISICNCLVAGGSSYESRFKRMSGNRPNDQRIIDDLSFRSLGPYSVIFQALPARWTDGTRTNNLIRNKHALLFLFPHKYSTWSDKYGKRKLLNRKALRNQSEGFRGSYCTYIEPFPIWFAFNSGFEPINLLVQFCTCSEFAWTDLYAHNSFNNSGSLRRPCWGGIQRFDLESIR